jgi:hypothetical protein
MFLDNPTLTPSHCLFDTYRTSRIRQLVEGMEGARSGCFGECHGGSVGNEEFSDSLLPFVLLRHMSCKQALVFYVRAQRRRDLDLARAVPASRV